MLKDSQSKVPGSLRRHCASTRTGKERTLILPGRRKYDYSGRRRHFIFDSSAKYRDITVFTDAKPDGRRDQLWDRDVAEVFLQPDPSQLRHYKEFEVSPNGFWIDLDIGAGQNT